MFIKRTNCNYIRWAKIPRVNEGEKFTDFQIFFRCYLISIWRSSRCISPTSQHNRSNRKQPAIIFCINTLRTSRLITQEARIVWWLITLAVHRASQFQCQVMSPYRPRLCANLNWHRIMHLIERMQKMYVHKKKKALQHVEQKTPRWLRATRKLFHSSSLGSLTEHVTLKRKTIS